MRTGAESHVGGPGPVGAIVHCAVAGEGPVGNLVVLVTGGGQLVADQVVLLGADLVRQLGVAALAGKLAKRAPLFYGELVGRYVLGAPGDQFAQRRQQHVGAHSVNAKDYVYADIAEAGAAERLEGAARAGGVVPAVHPAEHGVVQGLHAHAHPVDAERAQLGGVSGGHVVGVDLDGPLPPVAAAAGIGNRAKPRRRQHRRGAASKI